MKYIMVLMVALLWMHPLECSQLNQLKLDFDFFKNEKDFEKETESLNKLYAGVVSNLYTVLGSKTMSYPLPVVGYLYYYIHLLLASDFKLKDPALPNFFTHFNISYSGVTPSDASIAKKAVGQLVTKEIMEWLYFEPLTPNTPRSAYSRGRQNVNAYAKLVAQYILTHDMQEKNIVFAQKWSDKAYKTLADVTVQELLDCALDALTKNRPTDNKLATGTLFGVLGIDVSTVKIRTLLDKDSTLIRVPKNKKKKKTLIKESVDKQLGKLGKTEVEDPTAKVGDKPLEEVKEEKPSSAIGKRTEAREPLSITFQQLQGEGGSLAILKRKKEIAEEKKKQEEEEEEKKKAFLQPNPPSIVPNTEQKSEEVVVVPQPFDKGNEPASLGTSNTQPQPSLQPGTEQPSVKTVEGESSVKPQGEQEVSVMQAESDLHKLAEALWALLPSQKSLDTSKKEETVQ